MRWSSGSLSRSRLRASSVLSRAWPVLERCERPSTASRSTSGVQPGRLAQGPQEKNGRAGNSVGFMAPSATHERPLFYAENFASQRNFTLLRYRHRDTHGCGRQLWRNATHATTWRTIFKHALGRVHQRIWHLGRWVLARNSPSRRIRGTGRLHRRIFGEALVPIVQFRPGVAPGDIGQAEIEITDGAGHCNFADGWRIEEARMLQ